MSYLVTQILGQKGLGTKQATFNEQSQNPLAQNRNNSVSKLHHKQTSHSDYIQSDKLKEYTGTCSENPVHC